MATHTTLSQRLQSAMEAKKFTQRGLARAVGMRQQSIHYLLTATDGPEPKTRFIAKIADALGVDPIWLETGKGDPRGSGLLTSGGERIGKRIPVRDVESLKDQSVIPSKETTTDSTEEGVFAYDVADEAMTPLMLRGDRLIVAPKRSPKPGDIVLVIADGDVALRKLRVTGTGKAARLELLPMNPDYPTFTSDSNKINLLGTVVEQRRLLSR